MNNFDFYSPTSFVFGRDRENEAGRYVKMFGGSRVMVVYGGQSAKKSGLLDRVKDSIPAEGLSVSVESALVGDANGDGKIAMTDISSLRLQILGKRTMEGLAAVAADANGDGKIAMTDISALRLHILGKRLLF